MPAAGIATKLFDGKRVQATLDGSMILEPYKVTGLDHGDGDSWIQASGIPPKGTMHGRQDVYPGALVVGYTLIERINSTTLKCGVIYQSNRRFSGGPRPISAANVVENDGFEIPVWHRLSVTVGTGVQFHWFETRVPWPRARVQRVEVVFLTGTEITVVQNAIALNIGRWYRIPSNGGAYYRLAASSAQTDGFGRIRAAYRFQTDAGVQAFPANTVGLDNDLAIPELPQNGIYNSYLAGTPPSTFPLIKVVPITTLALVGFPLPGFNP